MQIIEIFKPENFKYTKDNLYYLFTNEIAKISGEGELLPHHEFRINYVEKYCEFYDFEIDYENDEQIYRPYKIILKSGSKLKLSDMLINLFIFTKLE